MLVVVSIKQRYPGHSRQAGFIASQLPSAAYMGKYTIVVDEDIDVTNLEEVIWAVCTRTDPDTALILFDVLGPAKPNPCLGRESLPSIQER
jgi:4-hydroxy-3-polyprenylbenzoate decarboxylase